MFEGCLSSDVLGLSAERSARTLNEVLPGFEKANRIIIAIRIAKPATRNLVNKDLDLNGIVLFRFHAVVKVCRRAGIVTTCSRVCTYLGI